ncbi:hypothetical protein [Streptomyces sp. ISL-44]|nr:hypothetical protein [Streptomyces sp. ISL-44]
MGVHTSGGSHHVVVVALENVLALDIGIRCRSSEAGPTGRT